MFNWAPITRRILRRVLVSEQRQQGSGLRRGGSREAKVDPWPEFEAFGLRHLEEALALTRILSFAGIAGALASALTLASVGVVAMANPVVGKLLGCTKGSAGNEQGCRSSGNSRA